MIYSLAEKKDALAVAKIHKAEIKEGFLSSLNVRFLENVYLAIIESDVGFCVVAKENDQVVGFISGVTDVKKLYSYFLKKYFFSSVVLLFKKFFNVSNIRKIFETLFYPTKGNDLPSAELLTMAVLEKFQGQGIAGKMLLEFLVQMEKRNVAVFKVLVGAQLEPAIHFYEKNGFMLLKEITLHGSNISRVYIYDII